MKTSVDQFCSNIVDLNTTPQETRQIIQWYEQAKQLEKEQIMKAAKYMYIKCKGGDGMPNIALKDLVEKYYNETYNI